MNAHKRTEDIMKIFLTSTKFSNEIFFFRKKMQMTAVYRSYCLRPA